MADNGVNAHFRVISNGIPEEYCPSQWERPNWMNDKFVILNIGRHAMEKRQDLLIKGVINSKYKDNIQLLLCGKGEDTEKLVQMGKELPVKPVIGYATHEEKMSYLNTSDLYLHSSVVELESLSCLEAIGCGLPCLIGNSPYSAAPQFAPDERFVFQMDDAVSLGDKIDYWYENRETLFQLKQLFLMMADRFRFDKCITKMESFYDELTSFNVKELEKQLSNMEEFYKDMSVSDLGNHNIPVSNQY
ncbi:glycosyltransferase [Spirochaetota bacterium]